MTDTGFVNISDYLGVERIHEPENACAAGYQCVARDPFDALPEGEEDFASKAAGCCQKCLNGQSCPAMTVGGSGYFFDNLCPDGHKCDRGAWPVKCEEGLMCSKVLVVNCSEVVNSARRPDFDFNASDSSSSTSNATRGMFDGAYCDGGASLGWCPGGYYCPEPDVMFECPAEFFCPPKSRTFQFRCADSSCGPGAVFDKPQARNQILTALVLAFLMILVLFTVWLNDKLNSDYEVSVSEKPDTKR